MVGNRADLSLLLASSSSQLPPPALDTASPLKHTHIQLSLKFSTSSFRFKFIPRPLSMRVTAGSNPDMKSFDGSSLGPIFRGHWVCGWMSIILYDLDQFLEVIPITDWKGWVGQGWWWWGGRGSCLPTFTSQRPNRQYELLDEIDIFTFWFFISLHSTGQVCE